MSAERHGDPLKGLHRVEELGGQGSDDPEVNGLVLFLRALFLKELLRLEEAHEGFEQALSWAIEHGLDDIEARTRANLAIQLTDLGRTTDADEQMDLAVKNAPASALGLVTFLEALLLQRKGLHHEAIAVYDRAVPLLKQADDPASIECLRLNRGVALIYLDQLEAARHELVETETASDELGLTTLAAMAAHNRGFLDGRLGSLADALAAFDRAEDRYRQLTQRPKQLAVIHSDRAEVLLQAGLATDAKISAARALDELEADGIVSDLTEARLLLARACLATGDYGEAKATALQAAREFRSARRGAWATQASYVGRQVDYHLESGQARPSTIVSRRFEYLSRKLVERGWPVEGRDALVFAALTALKADDTDRAAEMLVGAGRLRADGAVQHRARLHLARALLLRQRGERTRASAMIRRGVRDALQVLALTGSTEARLEALRFAGDLAGLGTAIALEEGNPIGVLRAVEQQRSVGIAVSPAGVSPHAELDNALDGLRSGSSAPADAAEDMIRQHSFRSRPTEEAERPQLSWGTLRAATASQNLIYFFEADDTLQAIVVRGPTTRVVPLATIADVTHQADFLQFALQRLAVVGSADPRAVVGLERESGRMAELLITPLALKDGPLVIVPCAAVKDLPWALLPLDGRDLTLAASGVNWMETLRRPQQPSTPRVLLVSGPELAASDSEVQQIAETYDDVTVLTGSEATVPAVLAGFAEADLVHIASHGVFRSESPMFSRLELFDGPLTIYDLERLPRLPSLVVLSACEIAASQLYPSGGALGTASALTALGARTVVAPVQPVADSATRDHMVCFHRHLSQGLTPAHALRLATAEAREGSNTDTMAAAATFVTIGAG